LRRVVVDASVVAKWLLPEIHSEAAARLLGGERQLLAPDLVWAEVGNILWKKWRRGELEADTVELLLADFRRLPLIVHPSEALLDAAWQIAHGLDRSYYDSLYLALAMSQGAPLVTADRKLWQALQGGPAQATLWWVEDLR
jgi:predicted nucleic acid-binding protein